MSLFRLRVVLMRVLGITKNEADSLIGAGRVRVDDQALPPSAKIFAWQQVTLDGRLLRKPEVFTYVLFHKPRGVECTLNTSVPDHLLTVFHHEQRLFPVGRLDKDSEGLLLLTNDGRVYNHIARNEMNKEKEYVVQVDRPVTPEFLQQLAAGISILGQQTRPARTAALPDDPFGFRIVLTQGLNRQIRRMCYKLNYNVTRLLRIRIVHLHLHELLPGQWRTLTPAEEVELLNGLENVAKQPQ